MGTICYYTLREVLYRRMGVVFMVISVLLPSIFIYFFIVNFERLPNGQMVIHGSPMDIPVATFVQGSLSGMLEFSNVFWIFIAIFAAAPLMTSFLEKGWVDLLLSKGMSRWQILLGRYLSGLAMFMLAMLLMNGSVALYAWARTGITPWRFFAALGITSFSFAVVLALMTLVGVSQPNAALLVMAGFVEVMFSRFLATREMLYPLITRQWIRDSLEWSYRIMPKHSGLQRMAVDYFMKGTMESWYAAWTSGLFLVVVLVLACWLLHRKSF